MFAWRSSRSTKTLVAIACVVFAGACSASKAQTTRTGEATSASTTTAAPGTAWPDDYGDGEQGAWTTGPLTARAIVSRARVQHANIRCVRTFIGALGFEDQVTWDLYLRGSEWILTGQLDDRPAEPYDAGTYSMWHVEGKFALFTSVGRGFRNDYWVYPRFDGDSLTMNMTELHQWQAGDDPACFVKAGATVEMTNTFERVE